MTDANWATERISRKLLDFAATDAQDENFILCISRGEASVLAPAMKKLAASNGEVLLRIVDIIDRIPYTFARILMWRFIAGENFAVTFGEWRDGNPYWHLEMFDKDGAHLLMLDEETLHAAIRVALAVASELNQMKG